MKGDITGMKNTEYKEYTGPRYSRETQRQRMKRVIDAELTEKQRAALLGYYVEQKNICQLARELGIDKSSVSRRIQCAEHRLRKYLRY